MDKQISAEKRTDPESKEASKSTSEELGLHEKEADRAEAVLKASETVAIQPLSR